MPYVGDGPVVLDVSRLKSLFTQGFESAEGQRSYLPTIILSPFEVGPSSITLSSALEDFEDRAGRPSTFKTSVSQRPLQTNRGHSD